MTLGEEQHEESEEAREGRAGLTLPLLIPALGFLFSLLVIYGLSRIYLEFDTYEIGSVSMATPLAIFVALIILAGAMFLANAKRVSGVQIGLLVMVAVGLLTTGGIWAAVHDEGEAESLANGDEPTPTAAAPGTVGIELIDFEVILPVASAAAGEITFNAMNNGATLHNVRIISTELAPDALPVDEASFAVDEDAVDVVAAATEIDSDATEDIIVELAPGPYVIICNIPTHYENGMRAAFTVE